MRWARFSSAQPISTNFDGIFARLIERTPARLWLEMLFVGCLTIKKKF